MGYHRVFPDAEIVGVDQAPMPRYPFTFHQGDAMAFDLAGFDLIHASPPCQLYSVASKSRRNAGHTYPDLLGPTRDRLTAHGTPWVIENVPGAPMRADFKLCGCIFGLPMLRRERWFETSWQGFAMRAPCWHGDPCLSVTGSGIGCCGNQVEPIRAHLGRRVTRDDYAAAMGIDWMSRGELSQAIPPAYTEYVARQWLDAGRP